MNGHHHDLGPVPQDLAAELEDLKRLLASQPVIEQSKGILMGHLGVGPDTAFQMLTRWSSHTNRKLRDIAHMLVSAAASQQSADPRRAKQLFIDLIDCLDEGRIPASDE